MTADSQATRPARSQVPAELEGKSLGPPQPPAAGTHEESPRASLPDEKGEENIREGFATHTHKYLTDYIGLADRKAGFIFAAVSAFLAYLESKGVTLAWLRSPTAWSLSDGLAFVATVLLVSAGVFAFLTVSPRLGGGSAGLVYFESIGQIRTPRDYADRVASLGPTGQTRQILEHCHALARVCAAKYGTLRFAMALGALGLIMGLATLTILRATLSPPGSPTS